MTLQELSVEYRAQAQALAQRIQQLEAQLEQGRGSGEEGALQVRIHMLSTMHREARELAALTERYYDRGYYRNGKYTV
jgi:BMFP domain-containing protein YqiC